MSKNQQKIIVVALGGNALIQEGQAGTINEQFTNTRKSVEGIIHCIRQGYSVVVTHGNGPQVGNMLLMVEACCPKIPELPLGVCVADTEGAIGYMIQQCMINSLQKEKINKLAATILTQVIVDKNDKAFTKPTKPIGPFFGKEEAEKYANEKGWTVIEDSQRGYRRVVPSPKPIRIVEIESIRRLLDFGEIVIAAGGGGIPVTQNQSGELEGIDAVIDKDLSSYVLARDLEAECLMMLTGTEKVFLNFKKQNQTPIDLISSKQAEDFLNQGHFPPGSMGPKIEAAISFLRSGGKEVYITSIDKVKDTLAGNTGTKIVL